VGTSFRRSSSSSRRSRALAWISTKTLTISCCRPISGDQLRPLRFTSASIVSSSLSIIRFCDDNSFKRICTTAYFSKFSLWRQVYCIPLPYTSAHIPTEVGSPSLSVQNRPLMGCKTVLVVVILILCHAIKNKITANFSGIYTELQGQNLVSLGHSVTVDNRIKTDPICATTMHRL